MKKIVTKTDADIEAAENYFISKKRPYKIQSTNYTIFISNDLEGWIISKYYSGFGLIKLIQAVRKDIDKNILNKNLELKEIKYYDFNENYFQNKQGIISGLEVDLSKAYLYSAYYQGFISEDLFNHLLSVKKNTRLKVLGALAVKKNIYYYDEFGKLVLQEKKQNDLHCIVWNNITFQVDDYINNLIILNKFDRFIFYWFDNLFMNISKDKFISIHKNYILKYEYKNLNYKWTHINLLQLNIDNRFFNFRKNY